MHAVICTYIYFEICEQVLDFTITPQIEQKICLTYKCWILHGAFIQIKKTKQIMCLPECNRLRPR